MDKFMADDIIHARAFSANHSNRLLRDKKCGRFYCLKIFSPSEIRDWIVDDWGTAICPYCSIDAVIGESSGYPVTENVLNAMRKLWF